MIKFKDVVESASAEKLNYIIKINGNPVWDYKSSANTVFLISEDTWDGMEDEFVTVQELKKYIVGCEIPFDQAILVKDESKEQILTFNWTETDLELNVDKEWTKNSL